MHPKIASNPTQFLRPFPHVLIGRSIFHQQTELEVTLITISDYFSPLVGRKQRADC